MDIITVISTVGFPIAMCIYFMFRFEKTISENTKAVKELTIMIKSRI